MRAPLSALLITYSLQELRQHPWRNAVACLAVALGVALALSVHLINASAMEAFSSALRSGAGQPDLELYRDGPGGLADSDWAALLHDPAVALALPVLERHANAFPKKAPAGSAAQPVPLRVIGIDVLQVANIAPELLPQPASGSDRLRMLAPAQVFLNASAAAALGSTTLQLQRGQQLETLEVAGRIAADGPPLAVMDIAAAQDLWQVETLTRVQIRLHSGIDRNSWAKDAQARADWPAGLHLEAPQDPRQRVDRASQAYRVNLTVLALMALFTGAFLVFSVLSLSVSRRVQQFALFGVLGMTGAQRLRLVLLEAGVLASLGCLLGVAGGAGLAALALHLLGGDLGGGYFSGAVPPLRWSWNAAFLFSGLGLCAALAGAWWPARMVQSLSPAQALKGQGYSMAGGAPAWAGPALLAGGALSMLTPPAGDIPLGAYAGSALLLLGGIVSLPILVRKLLDHLGPLAAHHALIMLAVERARRIPGSAAMAVNAVVAALSLAVAMTVMVNSFRLSVSVWLDQMLPASLYVRLHSAAGGSDNAVLDPDFVNATMHLETVTHVRAQHQRHLNLARDRPAIALIARDLQATGYGISLPLRAPALPATAGCTPVFVSEAMVDLYGARAGQPFDLLRSAFEPDSPGASACFFVSGIWRDYAHQFGSIAIDLTALSALDGKSVPITELALWLPQGAPTAPVQSALRALAARTSGPASANAADLLEISDTSLIRTRTMAIFDRSFAITYWLQAVAIGIGLFGVATSYSAQILARRKEFGLLAHLGLTQGQIVRLLAAESAIWTSLGSLAGIVLGLLVALVLVHVVNPQSFHWTMDLHIPWERLSVLALLVMAAGVATACFAARSAASHDMVRSVKEDW